MLFLLVVGAGGRGREHDHKQQRSHVTPIRQINVRRFHECVTDCSTEVKGHSRAWRGCRSCSPNRTCGETRDGTSEQTWLTRRQHPHQWDESCSCSANHAKETSVCEVAAPVVVPTASLLPFNAGCYLKISVLHFTKDSKSNCLFMLVYNHRGCRRPLRRTLFH